MIKAIFVSDTKTKNIYVEEIEESSVLYLIEGPGRFDVMATLSFQVSYEADDRVH